ncbi:hypothetical protein [Pontibacter rugosus]|uniref:Uncharacterized protein n=1 Tax=Pontibacter rugosus TaxID=1745966 RepID=A0ABW3SU20_9BACT
MKILLLLLAILAGLYLTYKSTLNNRPEIAARQQLLATASMQCSPPAQAI